VLLLVMFGEHWAGVVHYIASKTRGINSSAICTGCLQFLLMEVVTMAGGNGTNIEGDPTRNSVWNPSIWKPPPPSPPPPPPDNNDDVN